MKKILSLLSLLITSISLMAQWTTSGSDISNTNTGNVGIGVTNPAAKFEIASASNATLRVGITGNRANTVTQLQTSAAVIADNSSSASTSGAVAWDFYNNGTNSSWAGTYMQYAGTTYSGNLYGATAANQGTLIFQNVSSGIIASNGASLFMSPGGTISTSFLTDGSVGIGTSNTYGYKLAVNGTAIFTRAVVKLYGNWPDYVFKKRYSLTPLGRLADYIKKNEHLPGLPSADEIQKDGNIDLGQMNIKLLEKIEELTLYMIALEKDNQELQHRMTNLEKSKSTQK